MTPLQCLACCLLVSVLALWMPATSMPLAASFCSEREDGNYICPDNGEDRVELCACVNQTACPEDLWFDPSVGDCSWTRELLTQLIQYINSRATESLEPPATESTAADSEGETETTAPQIATTPEEAHEDDTHESAAPDTEATPTVEYHDADEQFETTEKLETDIADSTEATSTSDSTLISAVVSDEDIEVIATTSAPLELCVCPVVLQTQCESKVTVEENSSETHVAGEGIPEGEIIMVGGSDENCTLEATENSTDIDEETKEQLTEINSEDSNETTPVVDNSEDVVTTTEKNDGDDDEDVATTVAHTDVSEDEKKDDDDDDKDKKEKDNDDDDKEEKKDKVDDDDKDKKEKDNDDDDNEEKKEKTDDDDDEKEKNTESNNKVNEDKEIAHHEEKEESSSNETKRDSDEKKENKSSDDKASEHEEVSPPEINQNIEISLSDDAGLTPTGDLEEVVPADDVTESESVV